MNNDRHQNGSNVFNDRDVEINQFGEKSDQQSSSSSSHQHRQTMKKEEEKCGVKINTEWIYVESDGGIQPNQNIDEEPEKLCEVGFGSDSTLKHFKSPKELPSSGTDKSDTSKNCRKCQKLREKAAKTQKSKEPPKQYENLSTEEATANSKRSSLKTVQTENGSKTRQKPRRQSSTSKTVTLKAQELSKSQKKKKYAGTQPVYMPRSKYYRETDDESSKSGLSRRQRKRDRSSSTRRQKRNGKNRQKGKHQKQRRRGETTSSSSSLNITKIIEDDNDNIFYIGSYTAKEAGMILKPNEFRIYYQVPEKPKSIPYKLQLFLSYMSSQNMEVFHFPVVCGKNSRSGETMWSLRYTDSATFPTLLALIKYHKTYAYMDPTTGKIDTFPVWKGAIIDDEDTFFEC